MQTVHIWVDI